MNKLRESNHLVVGLDIGTSKIVVLVAELDDEGGFNIIGMGAVGSYGLKKGVVVSIEDTVKVVQKALQEAELMANCKIRDVYAGISGSHVRSLNSHGMVPLRDREVFQADVDRVKETARAVNISTDLQVLHVEAQEFIIDGQGDVRDPLGMSGVRLEVKIHIVTGAVSAAQNLEKCIRRCGVEVSDLILQPLASSFAVLNEDEKDLGVALLDIGGGTTDIAVFTRGALQHTAVLPVAGDQITSDIAMALRTPIREAEDLKIRHGIALQKLADARQMIDVPGIGERGPSQLSRPLLAEVIESRVEELFKIVEADLLRAGFLDKIPSGIVLTGGSSMMPGMAQLAEEIFHVPVRIGSPRYSGALSERVCNPRFATSVGLLIAGMEQRDSLGSGLLGGDGVMVVVERMKRWFKEIF
ncbi:MAG: cell division protein FtsA [Betaproteobacteria bacterium]|nr:MAG: cell division protein FtsA [Betaproteobacteria bacterium]